jgi:hypothetical protein
MIQLYNRLKLIVNNTTFAIKKYHRRVYAIVRLLESNYTEAWLIICLLILSSIVIFLSVLAAIGKL